ncbi:MAG TPA: MFS transporter [Casimicrobiaceae bacterium]|nr:MFS transporter [Casimicrobiaceae bacterium]
MSSFATPFARLYPAFAAGFLLSFFFRSVNAVISPELTRELALKPGSLGLLTSAYFLAFAAVQIPAGMLLDRYGPRRVESVLLAVAATGSLLFAIAGDVPTLVLARALIGAGCAACLMAPMKAIVTWYPVARQASLSGWTMAAGGVGALVATTPLEFALRFVSWRTIFIALAFVTYAVAAFVWLRIPEAPRHPETPGLATQWAGVRSVFTHARFWWIAPLGGVVMGTFMAIQGLWAVPWLIEVDGYDRAAAAAHLLVAGLATLAGYMSIGLLAPRLVRRGIHARHLFATGFTASMAALAAIVAGLPGSYLWWAIYGFGISVNVLSFTVLNDGFRTELAGRANTALNLVMFVGSFAAQWGVGLVVDGARAALGLDTGGGLKLAFTIAVVLNVATLAWFAVGWRREGTRPLAQGKA